MKIDVNYNNKDQTVSLTFFVDEFKSGSDYNLAISIIQTFAGDFNLDPELDIEDLQGIVEKVKSEEKNKFYFLINEDEIEAEIP